MYVGCAPQVRTAAAATAATPPQPLDPPPARAAMASPAISVRQQADDVSNVIQFENLRKEICKGIRQGTLERELVNMLHLDELYVLALKLAVSNLEPKSAGQISKMKTRVVSARARPPHMAQVEDSVLLTFISRELNSPEFKIRIRTFLFIYTVFSGKTRIIRGVLGGNSCYLRGNWHVL